jgi:SAM-dependent methyltransferase
LNAEGFATKQERARSFGSIADDYDRWRPGPSPSVVDWLLPTAVSCAVDLGAGTGAMSRLLVERVDRLVAVEPDARMRDVLVRNVPAATVLDGRGEHIPVPDDSADAVVVSSAWHWMDADATLAEVARVLHSRAVLGVVWAGVDPADPWVAGLRDRVRQGRSGRGSAALGPLAGAQSAEDRHVLRVPADAPFEPAEHAVVRWTQPMTADQLVGLLGTLSSVILQPEAQRRELLDGARRLLHDAGVDGDATVPFPFRARCWRAVRHAR